MARRLKKAGITLRNFSSGKRVLPRGKNHYNFKGGFIVTAEGYICDRTPDGHPFCRRRYMPRHRLVMEHKLGRYLLPGEVVNHINGNRQDNRPENLECLPSQSEHAKLGMPGMRKYKKLWDETWLRREYVNKRRALADIAQEIGCTAGAIRNALNRQHIPRRRYSITEISLVSRRKGGIARKPQWKIGPPVNIGIHEWVCVSVVEVVP